MWSHYVTKLLTVLRYLVLVYGYLLTLKCCKNVFNIELGRYISNQQFPQFRYSMFNGTDKENNRYRYRFYRYRKFFEILQNPSQYLLKELINLYKQTIKIIQSVNILKTPNVYISDIINNVHVKFCYFYLFLDISDLFISCLFSKYYLTI